MKGQQLSIRPPACLLSCRDLKSPNLLCDEHFRVKVSGARAALPTLLVRLAHHLQKLLLLPACMLAEVAGALATLPGNMPVHVPTPSPSALPPTPRLQPVQAPGPNAVHLPGGHEPALAGQRGHAGESGWSHGVGAGEWCRCSFPKGSVRPGSGHIFPLTGPCGLMRGALCCRASAQLRHPTPSRMPSCCGSSLRKRWLADGLGRERMRAHCNGSVWCTAATTLSPFDVSP